MSKRSVLSCAFVLLLVFALRNPVYAVSTVPDYLDKSLLEREGVAKLLRASQFQRAKIVAEAQLKNAPDNPGLLLALGYAEAGLKQWNAAVTRVKQAVQQAPPDKKDDVLIDLGNIYALQGKTTTAQNVYQDVLTRRPANLRALFNSGLLWYQAGEKEKARIQYQKVLQLDLRHQQAIAALIQLHMEAGRYEEFIPLARQLQQAHPEQEGGYYLEAVALARQAKPDYPTSVVLLQKALERNPTSKDTLYLLAFVLLKSGQTEEAASRLQEAIRLEPNFYEAHKLLAVLALQHNDLPTAAQHLEKAVAIRSSSDLYNLLGRLYLQLGQKEAGLAALNKSLEGTTLEKGQLSAAEGLYQYVGGNLEESQRKLTEALQQNHTLYETRVLLVMNLYQQDKYQEAIDTAQAGLSFHPKEQKVLLNLLAQIYLGRGMDQEAEKTLRTALKQDPVFPLTRLNLSAVYFQRGQYQKTEEELTQILKRNPQHLQAQLLLSRAYQAGGQPEKAAELLRGLLVVQPAQLTVLAEMVLAQAKMKHFDQALQYADQLLAASPEASVGYTLKSQVYVAMGNLAPALATIEIGLVKAGEGRETLASAAQLAFSGGEQEKSRQYIERYQAQNGALPVALQRLYAESLIESGKYGEARGYVTAHLPRDDDYAAYLIGLSWAKEGDVQKAEPYLERATQGDSRLDSAFFDLARVELTLGKPERAKEFLQRAITLNGQKEGYYLALALIHEAAGEVDRAIAVYGQGLTRKPDSVPLLNNLALLFLTKNDTQRALTYAQRALGLVPNAPNVLDTVGWVYVQRKEWNKALPYLEEAVSKQPEVTVFRYHLGVGYYRAGKLEEAERELNAALTKGGNAPWASEVQTLLATIASR